MASKGAGLAVIKATEKMESAARLREEYLQEGSTVYAIRRGGSASGMTHYFTLAVAGTRNDGSEPALFNITWHAAKVLGWSLVDRDGHRVIKVQGGGMDMGFHLVHSLSSALYPSDPSGGYVLKYQAF